MAAAIRAPRKQGVTLPAVRPNAGVEAKFRRSLDRLIDEMAKSVSFWLTAAYRANQPEMAQDDLKYSGSPARALSEVMKRLSRRWNKRFDDASGELARYFARDMVERSDKQLEAILERAGFTVKFKMTAAANDVMQATIGEQVGLIKSISQQYLSEVEGLVMRSVQTGRDLGYLATELQTRYGITKRRAAGIARDQNNKATASITRARQKELGVDQAVWLHSSAGKHPRPTHVAMDGKRYDVDKGMYDSAAGRYVLPGELINCRCVSKSVIPGFE